MATYDFDFLRKQIDIIKGDIFTLKLCIELTLYFDDDFLSHSESILNFYNQAIEHIKDDINFYDINGKNKFKKIKNKGEVLDFLPFWVSFFDANREEYGLSLKCSKDKNGASDKMFDFYCGNVGLGSIKLTLPLELLQNSPHKLIDLVKLAVGNFKFLSGHGGFGTTMANDFHAEIEDWPVYALSRRYLCIDFGTPHLFSDFMKDGIKGISWLTLLGNMWVEKLADLDALKENLSKSTIHSLANGILIQAGPNPILGDVNKQEDMTSYFEIGKILKDFAIPDNVLRGYDEIGGEDNTPQWLYRFY